MQKAIAYLRERQHNLDRQRQRRFLLDTQGLWVWDEENPKNKGKSNIVLSRQARELNDHKYRGIPAAHQPRTDKLHQPMTNTEEPMTNTEEQPKQGRGLKRSRSADTALDESAG